MWWGRSDTMETNIPPFILWRTKVKPQKNQIKCDEKRLPHNTKKL